MDIEQLLSEIYDPQTAAALRPRVAALVRSYVGRDRPVTRPIDQRDALLITYANMVQRPGEAPLHTLAGFLRRQVRDVVSGVHLLPFYPSSSDDGFSVVDYRAVDPAVGDWEDVAETGRAFQLMFDAVINHISAGSDWFQGFLAGDPRYHDYFVTVDPAVDLSAVFRPRALPLLTAFDTVTGRQHVWTTFSADQIDLNYANPEVLLEILELLLFYVAHGATFLRLDAIAFMWKEPGTNSLHRPQTHAIIQLIRAVLDEAAPGTVLITETNVPHPENISYFGDGRNEAHMVYNFSLPPLTLHTFHTGNAQALTAWARTLALPSDQVTFFNFLASHDGIGLTPLRGLLPEAAIEALVQRVQQLGGLVSYRHNSDGSQSAYELNMNYLDALGDPQRPDENPATVAARFLAAQAIMLALQGVPGIYFHSLFGSRGWPEGVQQTGRARTINRQKLALASLEAELGTAGSLRQRVFSGYRHLLLARAQSPAFHPHGSQQVIELHPAVFALWRRGPDGDNPAVLCLHNVSGQAVVVEIPAGQFRDLLSGERLAGPAAVALRPYGVLWLEEE